LPSSHKFSRPLHGEKKSRKELQVYRVVRSIILEPSLKGDGPYRVNSIEEIHKSRILRVEGASPIGGMTGERELIGAQSRDSSVVEQLPARETRPLEKSQGIRGFAHPDVELGEFGASAVFRRAEKPSGGKSLFKP